MPSTQHDSTTRPESRDSIDICPWCDSRGGEWSGRWRTCLRCGCSWLYTREIDALVREGVPTDEDRVTYIEEQQIREKLDADGREVRT